MLGMFKRVTRSRKFFVVTLVLFALQGAFLSVAVNPSLQVSETPLDRSGGVVPDGNRHIATIYYFAQQPLQDGPFIHDMSDSDLMLGDLERFPSYLYYYVMSIFTRLGLAIGLSDYGIVMMIRFIGLAMGLLVLVVFRKIVLVSGAGRAVANLATLGVATTGAFAYLAPAENYDVMALLFWMLFLLSSVRLFVNKDATQLYWMSLWFFVGSVTKYTYFPFMGLAGLIAVGVYIHNVGAKTIWKDVRDEYKRKFKKTAKWRLVVLGIVMLVAATLFVERIGTNLVQYQSVSPGCAVVHSDESCRNYSIYERNVTRAEQVKAGTTWTDDYHFVDYTAKWLARYYVSMYIYFGHVWVYDISKLLIVSVAMVVVMVVSALVHIIYKRPKSPLTTAMKYILVMTAVVILAQYIFNTRTYLWSGGEMYAHQGRYLLSIIGFVYVALLIVCRTACETVPPKAQQYVFGVVLAVGIFALLANSALLNLFIHASSPDWYSNIGRSIIPTSWYTR